MMDEGGGRSSFMGYGGEGRDKKDVSLKYYRVNVKSCTVYWHLTEMPSNEGKRFVFPQTFKKAARHGRIPSRHRGEASKRTKLEVVIDLSKGRIYPELEEEERYAVLRRDPTRSERGVLPRHHRQRLLRDCLLLVLKKDMGFQRERRSLPVRGYVQALRYLRIPIDLTKKEILDDKGTHCPMSRRVSYKGKMQVPERTARSARRDHITTWDATISTRNSDASPNIRFRGI